MAKSSSASSAASAASASASSLSSSAGKSVSSATSSVGGSVSSATDKASAAARDASSKISPSASSAASAASATATRIASDAQQGFSGLSKFSITVATIVTLLAIVATGIYFSGHADDVKRWGADKYSALKRRAEAMTKKGQEKAQNNSEKVNGLMNDSQKGNQVVGEGESEQVAPESKEEATQQGGPQQGHANANIGRFGEILS